MDSTAIETTVRSVLADQGKLSEDAQSCLLYTSDAADE